MKLELFKDDLRTALVGAERLTGKNLSLTALSHVLLEATGRQLLVRATNLDLGVEISLPAKVAEEGRLLVNGAALANFLGNLTKDDKITLETSLNNLALTTAHTKSVFNTYPAEDFPSLPRLAGTHLTLFLPQVLAGIKAVLYAAATSDIKPEIASVYLYQDQGDLVFVATDSFRLAEKRLVLEKKLTEPLALIIPLRNAAEILRVFEGRSGEVELEFADNQFALKAGGIYLTSRLVDGIFPDYRQIIPKTSATEVVVLRSDFANTLKLANVFSDKLNQINLKVVVKDGLFELSSRSAEVGEVASQLEATLEGEEMEASYNVRFILDCFSSLPSDSVVLRFSPRGKPLVVSGVGDNSFLYLVMPLNR